ncbi:MAG TPA: glycosyltransferase [Actinomycetes bacterium]|nr:glycosyltransferase [Actinomycetes bacterium]
MSRRARLPARVRRVARALLDRAGPAGGTSGATVAATATNRPASVAVGQDRVPTPSDRPRISDITVGLAAGERLRTGLAWEWRQRLLEPPSWQQTLAGRPDLVLLELAGDRVPGWGPADSAELVELVAGCRRAGTPIALWVTAGAASPNTAAGLVEAADVVFIADADAIDRWRSRWPNQKIEPLEPAAQPRLSAPYHGGPGARRELAGCLVVDPEGPGKQAAEILEDLVGPAIRPLAKTDLDVWRIEPASAAKLPGGLRARERGVLPYPEAAVQIGSYRVLVDAGRSDPGSTWAVLEAGAAGTAVVTSAAQWAGLPAEIAAQVGTADDQSALRSEIVARASQPELRDREATRLQRAVLAGHTYAHRVDRLLTHLGRPVPAAARPVSAVVPTNRAHELDNVFENIGRQHHSDVELVLVLHGLRLNIADLRARAKELGVADLTVVAADPALTLGMCMNLGIDAASGAYIAKMDDDNYYGRHYLSDLVRAFDYTDAGIVGKWAHYVWLRSTGAVVLRYVAAEHTFERRVQGGSMVIEGDLARRLRFADLPRAVDTDLLDRAIGDGVRIYSADRFNFVSVRGTDRQAHTWKVADSTFMTGSGRLVFYGDPRTHVEV